MIFQSISSLHDFFLKSSTSFLPKYVKIKSGNQKRTFLLWQKRDLTRSFFYVTHELIHRGMKMRIHLKGIFGDGFIVFILYLCAMILLFYLLDVMDTEIEVFSQDMKKSMVSLCKFQ